MAGDTLMASVRRMRTFALVLTCATGAIGCSVLPTVGPSTSEVNRASQSNPPIQVVTIDNSVARKLLSESRQMMFSDSLGSAPSGDSTMGPGDVLEISIWEAPPATLFGSGVSSDTRGAPSATRATTLPEQTIDRTGSVTVPFIGKIGATGKTTAQIEADIATRLRGKANQPEILVRRIRNASATVTVVGEVTNSIKMPLTPANERLLDALAAAGGVRQPVNKMTVQITRGNDFVALPLQTVIRDPRQNVQLRAGDVVTAIFQSLSFTALGSTGKNDEIAFEAQGISLAQALARAGGLSDARSDARGVFVFRLEPSRALDWPTQPVATTPDGLVPVIYRVDLNDPGSFFVMQSFAVRDKDILYVSNAPAAEFQKFLNLILSVAYPVLTGVQVSR